MHFALRLHIKEMACHPGSAAPLGWVLLTGVRSRSGLLTNSGAALPLMQKYFPVGWSGSGSTLVRTPSSTVWDEALSFTAGRMVETTERFGPEAVAFSVTTSSGTAIGDAMPWIYRLINSFGSPNTVTTTHVCNWHKDYATAFTFGADSGMPDFERTGCLILWGFNPSTCWLAQASAIAEAKKRGIVVDPRQAGLARKATNGCECGQEQMAPWH
jgi:predicted molibdopterin-dependent oxidoreductase YjgC